MHATPQWTELEQRLLETNSKLEGHPFPVDHLFNLVANCCPGPFTEKEALEIAPLLARVLSIKQMEYLLAEARQMMHDAAECVSVAALSYLREHAGAMDAHQKISTPAVHIAAPKSWAHLYSLTSQGALLLALMWAVLPPGDLPEPVA